LVYRSEGEVAGKREKMRKREGGIGTMCSGGGGGGFFLGEPNRDNKLGSHEKGRKWGKENAREPHITIIGPDEWAECGLIGPEIEAGEKNGSTGGIQRLLKPKMKFQVL